MKPITQTDALAEACQRLAQNEFISVDTEFMRESTYWPQLCLIQAAGGETEILIDPLAEGLDLAPFWELMLNQTLLKVLHAPRQDLEMFYYRLGEIPGPVFDTQTAAMALGLGDQIAYDALVREFLDEHVDKGSRFTDWSRRPLTDKQLSYALSDVTYLRDLFPMLRQRLKDKGRLGWAEEEMKAINDPSLYETRPEEAWRRMKLRKTKPAWLAALKAAAAWREREAQEKDSPRGRILKDDAIYEIAQHGPTSVEALGRMRGVPKGFERSRAAAGLIEAVREALKDPKANAPRIEKSKPLPGGLGPTTEMLKVLLRHICEDRGVAPRLIANVSDLEQIAAWDDADVPALKGWRRELFGEEALKLKRGETALLIENGKVVTRPV